MLSVYKTMNTNMSSQQLAPLNSSWRWREPYYPITHDTGRPWSLKTPQALHDNVCGQYVYATTEWD